MLQEDAEIVVGGRQFSASWLRFEEVDRTTLRNLYDKWRTLSQAMRTFHARGVNFPEGISEAVFALQFQSPKIISVQGNTSVSFDCYNPATNSRIQVKATSVEDDLTSFGPRSVWDELYFMDFFNDGVFDGGYFVYLIPNALISNFQISSTQTFRQQQELGRRPRLHMKREIIEPHSIKPIGHFTI